MTSSSSICKRLDKLAESKCLKFVDDTQWVYVVRILLIILREKMLSIRFHLSYYVLIQLVVVVIAILWQYIECLQMSAPNNLLWSQSNDFELKKNNHKCNSHNNNNKCNNKKTAVVATQQKVKVEAKNAHKWYENRTWNLMLIANCIRINLVICI